MRQETNQGFRRVALFLAEAARRGEIRSVFFASANRGEGTTTAVLEVARELRDSFGLKTLIVEWWRRRPAFIEKLGLDPERTVQQCLSGQAPLQACIQQSRSGLSVIPAGASTGATKGRSADALRRILQDARADFDIVLVDAPPILEEPDGLMVAGAVPHMVLVVRAGRTPHEVLERVQKEVASENVTIVGAILNQYRKFIPGWIYRWLIK